MVSPSPRAEWSDHSRENENEAGPGDGLADPFQKFEPFRPDSEDADGNMRMSVLYESRPPTPSETSDVEDRNKRLFEELQAITG